MPPNLPRSKTASISTSHARSIRPAFRATCRFTPEQKSAIRSIRLVLSLYDPIGHDLPSLWPNPFQEQPRPLHDAMVAIEGLRRISFIVRYRKWLWPHYEKVLASELLSSYEVLKKWVNKWVLQGCGTDYLECEGNTTHDGGARTTWIVKPTLLRQPGQAAGSS